MFALQLIALAIAAYGAYSQYQSSSSMAKQAKSNADYNAKVAANEAEQERLNRAAKADEEAKQSKRRRANIEAMYAKSGVLLTGTPADALIDQAETDELNIQEGNRASQSRQKSLLSQSNIIEMQGADRASAYRTQATSAVIQGVGSGIQGATSAYLDYGTPAKTLNQKVQTPQVQTLAQGGVSYGQLK